MPSRTTTRAPPPAAVSVTGTGLAAGPEEWLGPPEPLSTARSGPWSGPPVTSRATDQHSTRAITAATSTDQFGPPRVARIEPAPASSASNPRRGSIGASAYCSSYVVRIGATATPRPQGE